MAEVFISYRNTLDRKAYAERIAFYLRGHGVDVYWDDQLTGGAEFEKEIFAKIEQAKVVLVLWCAESVESEWVRKEARKGRDKLLPVRLQAISPPEEFADLHALDLTAWRGDATTPDFEALMRQLEDRWGHPLNAPGDVKRTWQQLPKLPKLKGRGNSRAPSAQAQPRVRNLKRMARLPFLAAVMLVSAAIFVGNFVSSNAWELAGVLGTSWDVRNAIGAALTFSPLAVLLWVSVALAVTARLRLHDIKNGFPGWWAVAAVIATVLLSLALSMVNPATGDAPFGGAGALLVLIALCMAIVLLVIWPGNNSENLFGPPPRASRWWLASPPFVAALVFGLLWLEDPLRARPMQAWELNNTVAGSFFAKGPSSDVGAACEVGLDQPEEVRAGCVYGLEALPYKTASSLLFFPSIEHVQRQEGVTFSTSFSTHWRSGNLPWDNSRFPGGVSREMIGVLRASALPENELTLRDGTKRFFAGDGAAAPSDPFYPSTLGRLGIGWSGSLTHSEPIMFPTWASSSHFPSLECTLTEGTFTFRSSTELFVDRSVTGQAGVPTLRSLTTVRERLQFRDGKWARADLETGLAIDHDGDGIIWRPLAGGDEAFVCLRYIPNFGRTSIDYRCVDGIDMTTMERRRLSWPDKLYSSLFLTSPGGLNLYLLREVEVPPMVADYDIALEPGEGSYASGSCRPE